MDGRVAVKNTVMRRMSLEVKKNIRPERQCPADDIGVTDLHPGVGATLRDLVNVVDSFRVLHS